MANPAVIDSFKLVQERQRLTGSIAVATLANLAESLHDCSGHLAYDIRGDRDGRERPLLRLQVEGTLRLSCQRCLEGFEHQVTIDTALRLVAAASLEAEYEASGADPDEPECIVESAALDIAALVEEEVLLALPPYPVHGRQGEQSVGVCKVDVGDAGETAAPDADTRNTAFSVLSAVRSTLKLG